MKIQITNILFLFTLVVFNISSPAQITIISADASAVNAVGNIITNHFDSITTSVNIGSTGATSWDFSGLNSHITNTFTSEIPSSTPFYLSDFPTSNVIFSYNEIIDNDTADAWQYSTQNPDEYLMDGILQKTIAGSDTFILKDNYSPPQVIFPLPLTYNSQWSSDFIVTNATYFNSIPISTNTVNHSETVVVDAWGNLTMPGGAVVQALRLRKDDRFTSLSPSLYIRTISYSFITKSGAAVEIIAQDTTAPNNGIIQTEGVTWSSTNNTVSFENVNELPTQYSLRQNEPNPFNQSSIIKFTTGNREFVQLKVYNVLGNLVATLVNEEKDAGSYEVNFDASQLPTGKYFYKLQAGNFFETKKMIIIR